MGSPAAIMTGRPMAHQAGIRAHVLKHDRSSVQGWSMVMTGWRARLGFLVPPGNPTVEPEMIAMAPPGVSVHFSRMVAHGPAGTLQGQEERNRSQVAHIGDTAGLLAMVRPNVIMLAHSATSY